MHRWLRSIWLGIALVIGPEGSAGANADPAPTPDAEPPALPCASAALPSTATSHLGTFRFVIPPGSIPRIGPLEMADRMKNSVHLRRAGGSIRKIVCMEYRPNGESGQGAWSIHTRGSFWSSAPFGASSCKAPEAVIVRSEDGSSAGISLRGAECVEGRGLTKGR